MDSMTVQETLERVRAGVRERAEEFAADFEIGDGPLSESCLVDLEAPLNTVLEQVVLGMEMGEVLSLVTFIAQDADSTSVDGTLVVLKDTVEATRQTTPAAIVNVDWVGDGVDGLVDLANEILDAVERTATA